MIHLKSWLNVLFSELYFTFFNVYFFTDICTTGITKRPPPRPPAPKNSPLNLVDPQHSTVGKASNKDDINIGEKISCKNSNPLPSNEDDCETKSNIKQPRYVMFRC